MAFGSPAQRPTSRRPAAIITAGLSGTGIKMVHRMKVEPVLPTIELTDSSSWKVPMAALAMSSPPNWLLPIAIVVSGSKENNLRRRSRIDSVQSSTLPGVISAPTTSRGEMTDLLVPPALQWSTSPQADLPRPYQAHSTAPWNYDHPPVFCSRETGCFHQQNTPAL